MVCIPCIVIPVLLVAYRKLLHPLVVRFLTLWRMSTESRFAVRLAHCLGALMWRPPNESSPPPSGTAQQQTATPTGGASPVSDSGLKSDEAVNKEAPDIDALRRRTVDTVSS